MDRNEAIKKLATLSQRERQVLGLVCAGTPYEVIVKTLFISLPTVKAVMGRVYVKLGLDQLVPAERRKTIYQVYGPLLDSSALPSEPMPPEKDEPVSTAIIKLVEEDAIKVIPPINGEVIYIPEPKKGPETPPKKSRSPVLGIIVGVFVIGCICIGAVLLGSRFIPGLFQNQPSAATQGVPPENPPVSYPTSAQTIPTSAPVQQPPVVATNPPQPTSAPLPTSIIPSISLPFSDTFDNGANPAWNILSGDWLTADGRYTISNADDKWAFSVLDDPSWTNYRIKVNVQLEHSDEGMIAIVVRLGGSKYLVFRIVNIWMKGEWAFYDGNSFISVAGLTSIGQSDQFTLEVAAIGNEFTAKINGMEIQRINLSGYENGGVGLGISCFYPPCANFSNFQVTAP